MENLRKNKIILCDNKNREVIYFTIKTLVAFKKKEERIHKMPEIGQKKIK